MIFCFLLILALTCLGVLLFKTKHKHQEEKEYKKEEEHNHRHNVTGEFLVSGKGHITIDLCNHNSPRNIDIHFGNEETNCHPCNPHHDTLSWQLTREKGYFQLVVYYDIGSIREIEYKVSY